MRRLRLHNHWLAARAWCESQVCCVAELQDQAPAWRMRAGSLEAVGLPASPRPGATCQALATALRMVRLQCRRAALQRAPASAAVSEPDTCL